MPDDSRLISVLESLRERGALGEASLPAAVAHADLFLAAIPRDCTRLIDLGSGGGLPGLVIACRLPDVEVVLTDRRERRMDLLRLACAKLGLHDRVTVLTGDVVRLAGDPHYRHSFDVVTARAFGDPLWTLECAVSFLNDRGVIVISEPPQAVTSARWPAASLRRLGLRLAGAEFAQVRRFEQLPPI